MRSLYRSIVKGLLNLNQAHFLERPLFVVSCGRSGSTALCSALGMHPQILMAKPEAPFIHRFGALGYDYALKEHSDYHQDCIQVDYECFRQNLKHQCYTSCFGVDFGFSYNPLNLNLKNSAFTRGNRLKFWGAKIFSEEKHAQGLLWLYPDARFIYLVRNGLDVVHSMSKFGSFAKLDFSQQCLFWSDRVFWYEYLRYHNRAIMVRFENFLNNNNYVFNFLYKFLEITEDQSPMEFASSTLVHSLDKPTENINPKERLLKRKPGYETWDNEQKTIFKNICSKAMKSLGYDIPF